MTQGMEVEKIVKPLLPFGADLFDTKTIKMRLKTPRMKMESWVVSGRSSAIQISFTRLSLLQTKKSTVMLLVATTVKPGSPSALLSPGM